MPERCWGITVVPVHVMRGSIGQLQVELAEDVGKSGEELRVHKAMKFGYRR
jgi:hypothetical protein